MTSRETMLVVIDNVPCAQCGAPVSTPCNMGTATAIVGSFGEVHVSRFQRWVESLRHEPRQRTSAQFFDDVVLALVSSGFFHNSMPDSTERAVREGSEEPIAMLADVVCHLAMAITAARNGAHSAIDTEPKTPESGAQ